MLESEHTDLHINTVWPIHFKIIKSSVMKNLMNLNEKTIEHSMPNIENVMGDLDIHYHDLLNLMVINGLEKDNRSYSFSNIKAIIKYHFLSHKKFNILFRINNINQVTMIGLMEVIELLNEKYTEGNVIQVGWSKRKANHLDYIEQAIAKISKFELQIINF